MSGKKRKIGRSAVTGTDRHKGKLYKVIEAMSIYTGCQLGIGEGDWFGRYLPYV